MEVTGRGSLRYGINYGRKIFYSGGPLKLLNNQLFCLDCIFSQVEAFSLALQACLRLTYSSTVILCWQIRLVQYHNFALSKAVLMVTNSKQTVRLGSQP